MVRSSPPPQQTSYTHLTRSASRRMKDTGSTTATPAEATTSSTADQPLKHQRKLSKQQSSPEKVTVMAKTSSPSSSKKTVSAVVIPPTAVGVTVAPAAIGDAASPKETIGLVANTGDKVEGDSGIDTADNDQSTSDVAEVVDNDQSTSDVAEVVDNDQSTSDVAEVVDNDQSTSDVAEVVDNDQSTSDVAEVVDNDQSTSDVAEVVDNDQSTSDVAEVVDNDQSTSDVAEVVDNDQSTSDVAEVVDNDQSTSDVAEVVDNDQIVETMVMDAGVAENGTIEEEVVITELAETSEASSDLTNAVDALAKPSNNPAASFDQALVEATLGAEVINDTELTVEQSHDSLEEMTAAMDAESATDKTVVTALSSPSRGQKRSHSEATAESTPRIIPTTDGKPLMVYTAVVLDIEGTTTPISFVHDVLFPHVTSHVQSFLDDHWDEPECQQKVADLMIQARQDKEAGLEGSVEIHAETITSQDNLQENRLMETVHLSQTKASVVDYIKWVMSSDRKVTALKSFQGYMWRFAFEAGSVTGVDGLLIDNHRLLNPHSVVFCLICWVFGSIIPVSVYDDVLMALKSWKMHGIPVFIYSSGSVEAQKLLFKYSDKGDLLEYFKGHYDTTTGPKTEVSSYELISADIGVPTSQILFVSDNVKEIKAACSAGYQVRIAVRPGNVPVTGSDEHMYGVSSDFSVLASVELNASMDTCMDGDGKNDTDVAIATSEDQARKIARVDECTMNEA
ncbi:2,3-diketo-5-methylthio-1-phosphopentane phosphatase [Batrachochytrium salamandrivorans]|nr:2,3-diketo-5-methylthio-1-phosphopentane phosphatase [Batrachochytrium salamandrivorans]